MALAPVRLALAALPVMRHQHHGWIVTIASIGGKMSVPHLLPHSTAKLAAVGFSEGLRAELGRGPVTVTTVAPGLMRTGSHLQAGSPARLEEFTWFSLGASLPLISMDSERAARQIIEAVRGRRAEIILTPAGQVVSRLTGLVGAAGLRLAAATDVEQVPPGRSGQPLQCLLEADGRTLTFVAGQLQVVDHSIDDLQAPAVLGGRRHGITGKRNPAGPSPPVPWPPRTVPVPLPSGAGSRPVLTTSMAHCPFLALTCTSYSWPGPAC